MNQYNIYALPAGFSGCAFWRYRLPLAKLQGKADRRVNIDIADNPNKVARFADLKRNADQAHLVYIQAPGTADVLELMRLYHAFGKKVAIDYDDFSFDLSPGNPRYAELGTKECELLDTDGKPIYRWRDGQNGFDLKSNVARYQAFLACLAEADVVTTTTDYLAEKFRPHAKAIAICPNSVDFDLWKPIRRPESMRDQVRIGWFGGDSHHSDLKLFKGLFPRLVKKYPNVKLVLQCPPVPSWREFFEGLPVDSLEWHNWADLKYYTLFLAARHFDIGLCPLDESMEFNRCKSNIKCLEFTSVGATVVAQDMIPYSNHIKHGVTGFLASTEDEWLDRISQLIEHPELRHQMHTSAYTEAASKHNLDINCRTWEKAFLSVLEPSQVGVN